MKRAKKEAGSKTRILEVYSKLADQRRVHPTYSALLKLGVTRNMIRHHFGSLNQLDAAARKASPAVFERLNGVDLFSPRRRAALKEAIDGCSRFIITTAVTGCDVDAKFLAALHAWCDANKGRLLILTASDPASNRDRPPLAEELESELVVAEDVALNNSFFISSIKLSAKHIDPITGLGRIGQRDGSFLYASPKQRLKLIPTAIDALPCALMTTGACTKPSYDPDEDGGRSYMSRRTAYIAQHDHVMGAVIVELDGPKRFHFRQTQADSQGRFPDLGKLYTADGVDDYSPEAIVLGDWHSRSNDPIVRQAFVTGAKSLTNVTEPSTVVLHDFFDGDSINGHEHDHLVIRAQQANKQLLGLQDELDQCVRDLEELAKHYMQIVISKSNHDEMLTRYLASGRFMYDPQNVSVCLRLAEYYIQDKDPLAEYIMPRLSEDTREKVRFLRRDESYTIAGIECGAHGDKGANGAKGSLRAMENAYGRSVSGHAHTPEILRQAFQVGTCSKLRLRYNTGGPSSWLNTSCLVYPNGARQLVSAIDGRWRAP